MDQAVNFKHNAMKQGAQAFASALAGFLCSPEGYKRDEILATQKLVQILSQLQCCQGEGEILCRM